MDFQLCKKKSEMKDLMERFIQTNKEHQELINENIILCSKIRQKKKEEVKKIKTEQKHRFKEKVKKIKHTILEQSKVGKDGQAVITESVLNKFGNESALDDTPAQSVNENFFSKIGKSLMVLGKSGSNKSNVDQKSNRDVFKKKTKDSSLSKKSYKDESQIIQKKDYRIKEISPLRVKPNSNRRNLSDDSCNSDNGNGTSIHKKKNLS